MHSSNHNHPGTPRYLAFATMLPMPLTRHSACIRCRRMKLRCPPRKDNMLSCGRCLRLKVNCVIPPPKDSSKPSSQSFSHFHAPRESSHSNQNSRRPSLRSMDLHEPPYSDAVDLHYQDQSRDVSPNSACPSFQNPPSSTIEMSEYLTPFTDYEGHKLTSADLDFGDFAYTENLPFGGKKPADAFPFDTFSLPETRNLGRSETVPIVSSFGLQSDADLTGLRLRLSQQYHQSRSLATTRVSGSQSNSLDEAATQLSPTGSVWFGDALQNISKFLSIVETYNRKTSTTAASTTKTRNAISMVITLDILSAYLQIVAVFNDLCTKLYDGLRISPHSSLSEIQTLPGLELAGLSVQHGQLQIKILLQAVVHHFEMIEKVLGLPASYRVSGHLDDYTGLFMDNQQHRSLMAIVMEDECGKRTVVSLKRNLKNIAQCIYM